MEQVQKQQQEPMSSELIQSRIRLGATFVAGVALGTAAMYFLDPRTGTHRRSLARDRISSDGRAYMTATGKRLRHLRNQLGGVIAASTDWLRAPSTDSDRKIADRVRTRLGRVTHLMQNLMVEVREGEVILSGSLPESDAAQVIAETAKIAGVRGVKDTISRTSAETGVAA